MDPRQTGEHQLFRNLVDQRDTETFLQVHQNLLTTQTEKTGTWRWIKVSGDEWRLVALCSSTHPYQYHVLNKAITQYRITFISLGVILNNIPQHGDRVSLQSHRSNLVVVSIRLQQVSAQWHSTEYCSSVPPALAQVHSSSRLLCSHVALCWRNSGPPGGD